METINIYDGGRGYPLPIIYKDDGWIVVYDRDRILIEDAAVAVIHADDPRDADHLRHLVYQDIPGAWCILDWVEDLASDNRSLADRELAVEAATEIFGAAVAAGIVRARNAIYGLPGASPLGALLM